MRILRFATLLVLVLTALPTRAAHAQQPVAAAVRGELPPAAALQPGDAVINASTFLGGLSAGATLPIGVEGEYIIREAREFGRGAFGVAARIHTYSWNWSETGGSAHVRYTPVAELATWHVPVASMPRWDFYTGLGLGYFNASYGDYYGESASASSGLYEVADVGARYAFTRKLLGSAAISLGSLGEAGLLRIGVAFRP